jgi:hypothetical protein
MSDAPPPVARGRLLFSDIEFSILAPPQSLDDATARYVQAHRRNLQEMRVAKLNANLSEFERLWPEGTPLAFFVAFVLCDCDPDVTRERLQEPGFIRSVLAHAIASGYADARPGALPPIPDCRPKPAADPICDMMENYGSAWLPARRARRAPAYDEFSQREDPEQVLDALSPVEQEEGGEVKLTFFNGRRRVTVGEAWQPPF